jgi:Amt family ammonium transporter
MSYTNVGAPAVFNGTDEVLGGDSTKDNLNQWYQSGDQAYILVCSCLVLMMIPGIAFLYSGLARRKSALSMLWVVMMSFSVVAFQWYFWGFSLAFSTSSGNPFIGDLKHFGLMKVWGAPSVGTPLVPGLLYSFYQMMFAGVTAALTIGAVAERGRVIPAMVFIFFWLTIVYCPLVYWVWNPNGWCFTHGVLDYAGGVPVEIASGMSAAAYSMVLGRRNEKMMMNFRPHNISLITLGTIFLFFGWLGFNGLLLRCQPPCRHGLLELGPDRHVRRHDLVHPRFPPGQEVVHGRLVLRYHFWPRCCHSRLWFPRPLGQHHPRCRRRCVL